MMADYIITRTSSDELMHFGIKGQKWGVRRYQNEDGTLTEEGKKRYLGSIGKQIKRYNVVVENANYRLPEINKKWNKITGGRKLTDKEQIEYNKDVAEMIMNEYEKVLVSELGPKKMKQVTGRDWIKNAFGVDSAWMDVKVAEGKVKKKESFDKSKQAIAKEGVYSWWFKNHDNQEGDSFMNYVWGTQNKFLNDWQRESYRIRRNEGSSTGAWDDAQLKYARQLAKNLGFPQTKENVEFMMDFFITGDD